MLNLMIWSVNVLSIGKKQAFMSYMIYLQIMKSFSVCTAIYHRDLGYIIACSTSRQTDSI